MALRRPTPNQTPPSWMRLAARDSTDHVLAAPDRVVRDVLDKVEVPLEPPRLLQASHRPVVVFGAEVALHAVLVLMVSVS